MMLDMWAREPPNTQDHDVFDAALCRAVAALGLAVDQGQRARMYAHFRRVIEANRVFNLTRITAPADAAVQHYADSLSLLAAPWIDAGGPLTVLDVGTGAGFPAIPLAIVCCHWDITAIDGTGKKARFVAETAAALKLTNVRAGHARAADLACGWAGQPPGATNIAPKRRAGEKACHTNKKRHLCCPERFDLVVLRAVTQLAPGLKAVHRLVQPAGVVVFYKTVGIRQEELTAGRKAGRSLGLQELEPFPVNLQGGGRAIRRQLICYRRSAY